MVLKVCEMARMLKFYQTRDWCLLKCTVGVVSRWRHVLWFVIVVVCGCLVMFMVAPGAVRLIVRFLGLKMSWASPFKLITPGIYPIKRAFTPLSTP